MLRNGFSLIEMLVCLFMIGCLMAIGIPLYTNHIIKAKHTDAKVSLLNLAAQLEQYYLIHQSYATATIASNPKTDVLPSDLSQQKYYQLSFIEKADHTFLIEAKPRGKLAEQDKNCESFRINQLGQKSITGHGHIAACWD